MRRGSSIQVAIRFDPRGLEDAENKITFDIFANTTSKLIGDKPEVKLDVRVIKRAELSLQGWARPEQSFYSGDVKEDGAIAYMEDAGTQLVHTYQVSVSNRINPSSRSPVTVFFNSFLC